MLVIPWSESTIDWIAQTTETYFSQSEGLISEVIMPAELCLMMSPDSFCDSTQFMSEVALLWLLLLGLRPIHENPMLYHLYQRFNSLSYHWVLHLDKHYPGLTTSNPWRYSEFWIRELSEEHCQGHCPLEKNTDVPVSSLLPRHSGLKELTHHKSL